MIDELLPPINLDVPSLLNIIFQPQINDWFLQAGNRWNCGTKTITKPTKYDQTYLSIHQHYNTHTHTVYKNIILVAEYYYQWKKDSHPPPSIKINLGTPSSIYFICNLGFSILVSLLLLFLPLLLLQTHISLFLLFLWHVCVSIWFLYFN